MAFIDGTVVTVALPALQAGLHATIGGVQWVVEAYTLFLAALILTGGSLGDLYSLRKVFAAGVALFAVASAWCGLAPNIGQLIAARSLQGLGGALLVPGSLALISASFPKEQRGRAIGTWSGFTSITSCDWACPRRLAGAARIMAMGLLHQPAYRAGGDRVDRLASTRMRHETRGDEDRLARLGRGGARPGRNRICVH